MLLRVVATFVLILALCAGPACEQNSGVVDEEEESVVVVPGKPDNFFGPTTMEFFAEGESFVVLASSYEGKTDEEKLERVKELIGYKFVVVGWFLGVYVADKSDHDENEEYGGFHALVRNGSFEDLGVRADEEDPLKYYFTFRGEIGATVKFMDLIPDVEGVDDPGTGKKILRLHIAKVGNAEMARLEFEHEWYRGSKYRNFDPEKYTGEMEIVDLKISPEERSPDGYIDLGALYADGVVTVGIHVGWDYYEARYDLKHARSSYDYLLERGFTAPVENYDDYKADSQPLTKTITVNGQDVQIRVWLVHPGQGDPG